MHEMSVAMAVVEQIERAPSAAGGSAESVRLTVGELAGVVPDSLSFCFSLACAGTVLEGAELHIDTVPGRAHCPPCETEWATGMPPQLCCPQCGGPGGGLLSGRELQIASVRWADSPALASPVPSAEEP